MTEMKTIRKYSLLVPAQLAQLELGSHGVEAWILDEGVAAHAPHFAMTSGIRLAVADEDIELAESILEAAQSARGSDD